MSRLRNAPWKGIYGIDRRYTRRVDRAIARGQYTAPPETRPAEEQPQANGAAVQSAERD